MKILVAGGTGFLGRHIARALLDGGHEVVILSRTPDKIGSIEVLSGAGSVRGDVTELSSLRGVVDGVEAVVMAVQFPNFPVEQPRRGLSFDLYDRRGTENLLAAAGDGGVERFLYVSGVNVHPDSDKSWYRAKGRAEESIKASGMRYAILRPSWAYGPEDKALNRMAKIARVSPIVPRLGARAQKIQPVYVEDIALAARRIFEREEAWMRTFEIGGPDVMTMSEVIATLLKVLGLKRAVVPVPAPLAKIATAPLDLLPKPPMNPVGVDFAVQDGLADTKDLEEILDVYPVPLEEGLRGYLPGPA